MDDECVKDMMSCDPEGPVMMLISKKVPTSDLEDSTFLVKLSQAK